MSDPRPSRAARLLPVLLLGSSCGPAAHPAASQPVVQQADPGEKSTPPAVTPTGEKPRVYCWLVKDPRCETGEVINAC